MGCENNNCGSCECEPESQADEIVLKPFEPTPVKEVVYVERRPAEIGFWTFFWGFLIGTLFFGC